MEERWTRHGGGSLTVDLVVDGEAGGIELGDGEKARIGPICLSGQTLAQLVFGYRSVRGVIPGLSGEQYRVLDALFPQLTAWVPGTDTF
jgi:hypothetical protein